MPDREGEPLDRFATRDNARLHFHGRTTNSPGCKYLDGQGCPGSLLTISYSLSGQPNAASDEAAGVGRQDRYTAWGVGLCQAEVCQVGSDQGRGTKCCPELKVEGEGSQVAQETCLEWKIVYRIN